MVGLRSPEKEEEEGVGVATADVAVGLSPPDEGDGVGVAAVEVAVGVSTSDGEGEGVDPGEGAGVVRPIKTEGAGVGLGLGLGLGIISSDVSTSIIRIAKSAEPRLVSSHSPCVNPANTICPLVDEVAAARKMSEFAVPSCKGGSSSKETHQSPVGADRQGGQGLAKGGPIY